MHKINRLLLACIILTVMGCKTKTAITNRAFNEPHRPQYHFSPPKNWMNDPNGMVYFDGEYHLFYQYYPDGNTWGPMHWGHALSTDMVHWQHLPIALYPDSLGYIFSGSAVIDWKNTSGLGKDGKPPMIAIYTYHNMEGEKAGTIDFQNQGMAYSLDKGRTWTKYKANPILKNPGIKDFRDPKVIWHEGSQSWVMALAVKNKVSLYTSPNLINWTKSSDFNPAWAAYGGVWECPDFFPLQTQDGQEKWVLLVSMNPGAPNGGSGTQYFVGEFDGKTFQPDKEQIKWLDYGADNYAGVTWSDIPKTDGRRLFIGWMSNWQYAQKVPTEAWRSAMTLPRTLTLQQNDSSYTLLSAPAKELEPLRKKSAQASAAKVPLDSDLQEIELTCSNKDFQLVFSNVHGEKIVLEKMGDQIIFDRSQSGNIAFDTAFPKRHYAPTKGIDIKKLRIFIDRSSIEFFFNDGALVMTELVFPKSPYTLLETQGMGVQATVHQLGSIWGKD